MKYACKTTIHCAPNMLIQNKKEEKTFLEHAIKKKTAINMLVTKTKLINRSFFLWSRTDKCTYFLESESDQSAWQFFFFFFLFMPIAHIHWHTHRQQCYLPKSMQKMCTIQLHFYQYWHISTIKRMHVQCTQVVLDQELNEKKKTEAMFMYRFRPIVYK